MSPTLLDDLELTEFLGRFFLNPVQYITCDTSAIRERNEVCKALLENKSLMEALQRLYDAAQPLLETAPSTEGEPIQVIHSMIGVRIFRDAVLSVTQAIAACRQLPPAITALSDGLNGLLTRRYPIGFDEAWNRYADGVEKTGSMSYHIRFSDDLAIEAIALTGAHRCRYEKSTMISRAVHNEDPMRVESLLPLDPEDQTSIVELNRERHLNPTALQRFSRSMRQLFLAQTSASRNQLAAMERGIAGDIRGLIEEIRFALGMVEYTVAILQLSPNFCYAGIRNAEERSLVVSKMIHPLLAEQTDVVANDISIQSNNECVLLGGINRGGKTTYLRTAGAMQILFQMGLPLPAASAEISPASGVYSAFSREEITDLSQGKLGRELIEMREAIAALDDQCLFLGNEPISGTSPLESYVLSRESLCMLKAKHARGIWVTHLFELFDDVEKLNDMDFGSQFACMHTRPVGAEHSFAILPGIPKRYSGAREMLTWT